MYNTCVSSAITYRCKGSVSFSYNDYSHFLKDGIDRYPIPIPSSSSSSSCCSCCTNSTYKVPKNPTYLYGLRQSTLIQWSPSRRLIYRFPVCDVDDESSNYGNSCSFKERGFSSRRRGRWRQGRLECVGWEESRRKPSSQIDEAEAIISLLAEVTEEGFGVRGRNSGSSRLGQVENRGKISKNKNVGSGSSKSSLNRDYEYVRIQSKEDDYKRKENVRKEVKENLSRSENLRARKGSSSSSYYSFSSVGEFDSDSEVPVKDEKFVGDSSCGYRKGLKQNRVVIEEVKGQGDVDVEHEQEDTAGVSFGLSSGLECDWRKKSEKKLSEISKEQTDCRKESSQKHSRLYEVNESDYRKTIESHKQSYDKGEKSTYQVNINEGTKRHYNGATQNVAVESDSRMKYKQFDENPETRISEVETTSGSQKQFSSLVQERTNRHHKTDQITRHTESSQKSQQFDEVSEVQEIDLRGSSTSQRQSETRARIEKHHSTMSPSSVQGTKEQLYQESKRSTRKTDSKQLINKSDSLDTVSASTSTSKRQTNTWVNKLEESSDLESSRKVIRRKESDRKTQNIDDVSVARSTGVERISDIQIALENRISSQERYLTSLKTSVEETRDKRRLTDEIGLQVGSRKEAQLITKASSFNGGMSKEGSGTQTSLQLIMTAPSSQSVERDRQNVASTSGIATQESGSGFTESGCSVLHEDALVSADRMQKSTVKHIGEFVEKAKHELSISEVQNTTTVSEGTKGKYGSEDSQSKANEPRRPFRGTKGPADEKWDVTNPSLQESAETEVTPSTVAAETAVAKRTGRSLWNVIADIVQLRWARSDSHNSTAKSGGRSSSHKSVSSETWFSGHEQDEYYDEKVNDPENPESGGLLKVGKIAAQSPGTRSSSRRLKDKMGHAVVEMPSSSSLVDSGSASKSISPASGEENFGWKEDQKNFQGTLSGVVTAESSVRLPAGAGQLRSSRSSSVEEISGASQTDTSSSGLMVQMEQPSSSGLSEMPGTGRKDGELKRRKLQRIDQVPKDRYDEWEEAFNLESEQRKIDEVFMREALLEAKKAADSWEVPVGAVLVQHGKIIARGWNLVEELRDSTAHAEMICIREASNQLRTWRLSDTTLYVTLEPCPMCAGAILQARIDTVVWGAPNKLLGADGSWIRLFPIGEGGDDLNLGDKPAAPVHPFHPKMNVRRGVMAAECADAMQQFFQLRRRSKKKDGKRDSPPPTTSPSPPPSCLPISQHPSKLFSRMHHAFHIMFCL